MGGSKTKLLLVLAAGIVFLALFQFKAKDEMADFEVNYKAGHRLGLGETLYRTEDQHWQFKYSPFSALIYLPLSFLPVTAAKGVWYLLIIFSTGTIVFLSWKLTGPSMRKRTPLAVLFSCLILARFFLREVQLGQINMLITAILMAMIWLIVANDHSGRASRERSAGILCGLASALKPYAVIFFPYFILRRKWRVLGSGLIILGGSFMAPSIFYGFKGNLDVLGEWITSLSQSTPHLLDSQDNVSLLAFLVKWTGNQPLSITIFGAAVAALIFMTLIFILQGKSGGNSILPESALLLLYIPLLSPLGWDYTFLSSFLAVVLILKSFPVFPKTGKVVLAANFLVIALSLYDVVGRRFYATFMSWSVFTVNFFIVVMALFYLRLKKAV
jgi:hypothetical protein